MKGDEQRLADALKPFGWLCTEDFWQRYYSDAWVFHLANAVERLSSQLAQVTDLALAATTQLRDIENNPYSMEDLRRNHPHALAYIQSTLPTWEDVRGIYASDPGSA